ncbi:hypothetical protein GGP62_002185 [Salinibacter ruber]|uniref:hypothetical protein n=1 Tax=Salinibacter ruber TaxID=146919 RepID=UPI0021697265|nr:hypothetical protein [Salinibacter ruber]MCS3707198.1 hypothetical protein [Salinibacter ruber]
MDNPIEQLEGWQRRARQVADEASSAGTKKAVQQTEMDEEEREAARHLFASCHDVIEEICRYVLRNERSGEQTPSLELEGLLHQSYLHFLRALVRFRPDKGELDQYLRYAMGSRLKAHVQSKSVHRDDRDEEEREPVPSTTSFRRFDVVAIVDELVESGRLDVQKETWERLTAAP